MQFSSTDIAEVKGRPPGEAGLSHGNLKIG